MFCLLVHSEIPAEDLEDESTDLSRRSDKEQGRRYCAKLKNKHNILFGIDVQIVSSGRNEK